MARRDACFEEVRDRFAGVDESLYEVYRKIATGTTANLDGHGAQKAMHPMARRRLYMLELSAAGMSAEEIAKRASCSIYTVRETVFGVQQIEEEG